MIGANNKTNAQNRPYSLQQNKRQSRAYRPDPAALDKACGAFRNREFKLAQNSQSKGANNGLNEEYNYFEIVEYIL